MRIVEQVWLSLSELDRQLFHQYTCLNRRGEDQLAVMEKIAARLREQGIPAG